MSEGESKEQMSISMQRTLTENDEAGDPALSAQPPPSPSPSPSSSSSSSSVPSELSQLTCADIACIQLPSLPSFPLSLFDPLSPLVSPRTDGDDAIGDDESSNTSTTTTITTSTTTDVKSSLLNPFVLAYENERRLLLSIDSSLKRLHSSCLHERSNAVKSAEKKSIAMINHSECEQQQHKLTERINTANAEQQRLSSEIAAKTSTIQSIQQQLSEYGEALETQTAQLTQSKRIQIEERQERLHSEGQEQEELRNQLVSIREKNIDLFVTLAKLTQEQQTLGKTLSSLEAERQKNTNMTNMYLSKKTELEEQMKNLNHVIVFKQNSVKEKAETIEKLTGEISLMDANIHSMQEVSQKLREEEDKVKLDEKKEKDKLSAFTAEISDQEQEMQSLLLMNDQIKRELRDTRRQRNKSKKMKTALQESVQAMTRDLSNEENLHVQEQRELDSLDADKSSLEKKVKFLESSVSLYERELDILTRQTDKKEDAAKAKQQMLQFTQSKISHICAEKALYASHIDKLRGEAITVKQEIAHQQDLLLKQQGEQELLSSQLFSTQELLSAAESECSALSYKVSQQTQLLMSVMKERDASRAHLLEMSRDIKFEKKSYQTVNLQNTQLKKKISDLEHDIQTQHRLQEELTQEINLIQNSKQKHLAECESRTTAVHSCSQRKALLTNLCADGAEEEKVQQKQVNQLISEERVLNAQLIKRETELNQVYAEYKLLTAKLQQAEQNQHKVQHNKKAKTEQLETSKQLFTDVLAELEEWMLLTNQVSALSRVHLLEQRKCRGLEEEWGQSMNVHRWREMRDGQGEKYGMMHKIRQLQRKLIHCNTQTEENEQSIQQQQRLFNELSHLNSQATQTQQSVPLAAVADDCTDRKDKVKSISGELNLSISKKRELDHEISCLHKELDLILLKWFNWKRKQQRKNKRQQQEKTASVVSSVYELNDDDGSSVLLKSSFAPGELYDQEGHRIITDEQESKVQIATDRE